MNLGLSASKSLAPTGRGSGSITQALVRNAAAPAPPRVCGIRVCVSTLRCKQRQAAHSRLPPLARDFPTGEASLSSKGRRKLNNKH